MLLLAPPQASWLILFCVGYFRRLYRWVSVPADSESVVLAMAPLSLRVILCLYRPLRQTGWQA